MDSLKDTLSNISLYDVKAYVRKAQNGMSFSPVLPKFSFELC